MRRQETGKNFPRLDEILQGREIKIMDSLRCFETVLQTEWMKNEAAHCIRKIAPEWMSGKYRRHKFGLPYTKTQVLDIETRGLGKCDQTWAIGTGFISRNSGLVIRQFIARDPLEETALIEVYSRTVYQRPDWVVFNRSFEKSRLRARAEASEFTEIAYRKIVDLYHDILRKKFRELSIRSATLATAEKVLFPAFNRAKVEKQILEKMLKTDAPAGLAGRIKPIDGAKIPGAYNNYALHNGNPLPVLGAVGRNACDVLTSFAIYLKVLKTYQ